MRFGLMASAAALLLVACGASSDQHAESGEHGAPEAHGDAHAAPHGAEAAHAPALGPASAHAATSAVAAHGDANHWSYLDQAAWAQAAAVCAAGHEQSPINLSSAAPVSELPDLEPRYLPLAGGLHNNGHTLQFAPQETGAAVLMIGQDMYSFAQFHFHASAEHTLDRRAFPVELHFVHRNSAGQLAVLGVFIEEGAENPELANLMAARPTAQGEENASHLEVNLNALLPSDRAYFAYAGSLTTPPCSEGVRWNVLRTPIQASPEQIAALRESLGASSRHVQPLGQRTVLLGL